MLRFLIWAIILMTFLAVAVTLVISTVAFLALACVVGFPLYLLVKPHLQRFGSLQSSVAGNSQAALERLKTLYVEGKIDLFEFERRAAHLISTE